MDCMIAFSHFGIQRFFEPTNNVLVQLRELFDHTKAVFARDGEINLEVVLLIAALELGNAAVNLCMWGGKKELASALGLTFNQYLKGAQAGRVLHRFPDFIELVQNGATHLSHIGTLAPKITAANKDFFLRCISGKSERELRALVAGVNKDGTPSHVEKFRSELKLSLTSLQRASLERVKDILTQSGSALSYEEAVGKSLEFFLDKYDTHSVPNVPAAIFSDLTVGPVAGHSRPAFVAECRFDQ